MYLVKIMKDNFEEYRAIDEYDDVLSAVKAAERYVYANYGTDIKWFWDDKNDILTYSPDGDTPGNPAIYILIRGYKKRNR